MDIPGVHDDWEHQVTPLLQDMSNCAGNNTSSAATVLADLHQQQQHHQHHHQHHDDYSFNPNEVSKLFRLFSAFEKRKNHTRDSQSVLVALIDHLTQKNRSMIVFVLFSR